MSPGFPDNSRMDPPARLALFTSAVAAVASLGDRPGDHDPISATGERLWERWREPHRGYHDIRHLDEVLAAVGRLGRGADPALLAQALLAACYHDAIYDPTRDDNESASAALANAELAALGVPPDDAAAVAALVLETREHDLPPPHTPSAWLHDADLWILAAPTGRFDDYCAQVRREYAAVPPDLYARERGRILGALRDRPRLYASPLAYAEWEPRARANLRRELERLAG